MGSKTSKKAGQITSVLSSNGIINTTNIVRKSQAPIESLEFFLSTLITFVGNFRNLAFFVLYSTRAVQRKISLGGIFSLATFFVDQSCLCVELEE